MSIDFDDLVWNSGVMFLQNIKKKHSMLRNIWAFYKNNVITDDSQGISTIWHFTCIDI